MTKIQDNHKDLEQLSISTTALYKAFIELGGQKLMTIYCHPAKDLIVFDFECGRLTLNMKTGKLFSEIQDGSPLSPIPLMHPVLKKYSNGLLSESWTVYSPHSKTLGFLFNFGINEYENILFLCSNLPFFYVYQAPTLFENLVKENDESNITTDSILPQTQFLKFDFQKPK